MPRHSENTKRIVAYLSYLRDVSRKIVSRTGFEKCLLNKKFGYAVQFDDLKFELGKHETYFSELHNYINFLERSANYDKKLYLGFGTIIGTRKRIFAAPFLIVQCEIELDEKNQFLLIEPSLETLNINYDLISALSTNYLNEEDDVFNPFTEEENRALENIETELKNFDTIDIPLLHRFAKEAFNELRNKSEYFQDIEEIIPQDYDFKNEREKYTRRPGQAANQLREKSLFEKELHFVNANHFFVNNIPDQLSTYEALNSFIKNISEEGDFSNPVVEKLLVNALTDDRIEIEHENVGDFVQSIINQFVPISLSGKQIDGIKNAWINEISYIQGPPGTGKSHTISAIILSAIALNKKVLVISQKPAALQVVNEKIEPYLSDEEGLLGICYYDKSARRQIKEYCASLIQKANSASFSWNISVINKRILELERYLHSKSKDFELEENKIRRVLEKQRKYKELNERFLKELYRFNEDYIKIPSGFSFTRMKDVTKYFNVLDRVEILLDLNTPSLSSKLYIHKFKNHLLSKFQIPEEWLSNTSSLYFFSKAFIQLNAYYTEAQNKFNELSLDINYARKELRKIKQDIYTAQKELVRLRFKGNVFNKIRSANYQNEIDKFDRMLYNTNSRLIDKKMQEIDFSKITDVIPFWTAEIRHLGHLFPLQPDLFDLVIVDESSQVNLAEILPAFYRARHICIVGDHLQLSLKSAGLNFSLSKNFDELTWEKYNRGYIRYQTASTKKLTVSQASILDFIKSEEYNAVIREIMLDEHFRSLPHLARFTSKEFYRDNDNPEGKLKIMTETPDKMSINCFKAVRVNGKRDSENKSKIVRAEAFEILKIIQSLITQNGQLVPAYSLPTHIDKNNFTIGVISMIREQCEFIEELLQEKMNDSIWEKYNLMIGTPEEFQGNERDIIIFSLCLDNDCERGQGHFQDAKRLNVATSRAKYFTYFVYSPFPDTFNKIYKYLHYINGAVTDEDIAPNSSPQTIGLPPFNPELFESDFERHVYLYLNRYINSHPMGHHITIHNQIKSCGQKRLDFVLFNHNAKKSVAIEVDGRFHFSNNALNENYTFEHMERIDILTRAGWNIINTPYHKWYKNGWLAEETNREFKEEVDRIYSEINNFLF